MSYVDYLLSKQHDLKVKLITAKVKTSPRDYIKKSLKSGIFYGTFFAILTIFFMGRDNFKIGWPILVGVLSFWFFYNLNLKKVDVLISKKAKEIDKGVLFAGRFLLIKLSGGGTLIGSIEDVSNNYGVASNYFKEIIREVELGSTLEHSLEKATRFCPSKDLKQILFQITNALKIGIDVTQFLEATVDEIADSQLVEIMRYGKKLSSLTMFYMLLAIIVPSLGMTLFVVIASLISVSIDMLVFSIILFVLVFIQFMFITLFKSARPNMDI